METSVDGAMDVERRGIHGLLFAHVFGMTALARKNELEMVFDVKMQGKAARAGIRGEEGVVWKAIVWLVCVGGRGGDRAKGWC